MDEKLFPIQVSLDMFCEFAKTANFWTFKEIFGERLGEHFWNKHIDNHDRNMTWTYNDMDNENRNKLVKYLLGKSA
jgi:hypothetical protein